MRTRSPPHIPLTTVAKRRARITPDLKNTLEVEYQKNSNPKKVDKIRIAQKLSMSTNSVHFWFQNRRAEESKKKKKEKEIQENTTLYDNHQDNDIRNIDNNDSNNHLKDNDYNSQHQQHQYFHQHYQQPIPFSKTHTQLPPIATILEYNNNFYLPNEISMVDFYFHHHHYGIGSCFIKWQAS